jgi:hypothetical protein
MGIGRLPTGEMEFANGGIVAFAGGGDVERYSGEFGSLTGEFGGFDPERAALIDADKERKQRLNKIKELETKVAFLNTAAPQMAPKAQAELDALKARDQQTAPAANLAPVTTPSPLKAETSTPPAPKAEGRIPSPSNFERADALSSPSTLDALQKKYFGDIDSQQATFKTMREGLVKGMKDVALANLEQDRKDAAERSSDKVYKGREERLAKQEKDLGGLDDRYLGLAMLKAGAAMMSTPGGIGAAIGKGVGIGAAAYAAGLDKINVAQAKFAEARDRLDDLRINRDDMSAKQVRESLRAVESAELKGQEFMLNTLEKDFGIKRDVMGKLFTAAADDLQTTRRIAAQKATAGKQDTNEQMKAALFADLKNKYPNDPARVATEFNKAIAKASADPTALYRQELAKQLAEEKVKLAKIGNVEMKGQKEKIQALEKELFGGSSETATPLPANASEKTLVVGTTYQTAKGPAKWTGKEFMPI